MRTGRAEILKSDPKAAPFRVEHDRKTPEKRALSWFRSHRERVENKGSPAARRHERDVRTPEIGITDGVLAMRATQFMDRRRRRTLPVDDPPASLQLTDLPGGRKIAYN